MQSHDKPGVLKAQPACQWQSLGTFGVTPPKCDMKCRGKWYKQQREYTNMNFDFTVLTSRVLVGLHH